ncbi:MULTISPECIES: hypothetical protein [unclassified Streptomyces]|uniref:hypothetical protein n=1 Tax=unclassified Streptomyces TaxID=2593676 RepID=UPI000DBAC22A|nr:hypothetical protein [Streptomyces sp. PsTaAH-130]MYU07571.1 hypothetical protein [Streptomyces sp. SID8366]MYU66159.1 hypothetical protein [Streptomyces sp. SID69]RAJ60279.1 hypothetical protein K376_02697 [Streptomyces sp. PsTaAH-130]
MTTMPSTSAPRQHVATGGGPASARHTGRRHPPAPGPEARRPVLRLAGDADDAGLEPHICRGID